MTNRAERRENEIFASMTLNCSRYSSMSEASKLKMQNFIGIVNKIRNTIGLEQIASLQLNKTIVRRNEEL